MIPLIVIGYLADKNLEETGLESTSIARGMGERNLGSAKEIGKVAIEDSVRALDEKSTEAIELRTMELAHRIADFLYERDNDILILADVKPDPQKYLEEALTHAFSQLPDIILLDVKLPKLNGIEVCKRLKSDDITKHIPILILSAKAQSDQIAEGLRAGADRYLCKPISFPDILKEIKIYEDR